MRFDEVVGGHILPFEATLKVGEKIIGRINGTFDREKLTPAFFSYISDLQDNSPTLIACVANLVTEMIVSWDLVEDDGTPCEFDRIWDMPAEISVQILSGMFGSMNGEPPEYLKGLV
jgi:hypothetical protein